MDAYRPIDASIHEKAFAWGHTRPVYYEGKPLKQLYSGVPTIASSRTQNQDDLLNSVVGKAQTDL